MTKTDEVLKALDDLRVAADVCELDENATVARQAIRIRAARAVFSRIQPADDAVASALADLRAGRSYIDDAIAALASPQGEKAEG